MKFSKIALSTSVFLCSALPLSAYATTIIGATSVSTTMGSGSSWNPIGAIIDQSGLITPGSLTPASQVKSAITLSNYISGVTDFDSFVAGTVHNWWGFDMDFNQDPAYFGPTQFAGEWFASGPPSSGYISTGDIIFGLDSTYIIDHLALWNEDSQGISTFNVYTSLAENSSWTKVNVSLLTGLDNARDSNYTANVFDLTPTLARYIKLEVISSLAATNGISNASIGEVVFGGNPVPEPTTMLLLGSGLLGLLGLRRKK